MSIIYMPTIRNVNCGTNLTCNFFPSKDGVGRDSNMTVAAVARVHVLAWPSVWQMDDFDV